MSSVIRRIRAPAAGKTSLLGEKAYVHNFSSKIFAHAQMAVLRKDAGCSIGNTAPVDVLAALELRLHQLNLHDVAKQDIRVRIAEMLERARITSDAPIEEQ